MADGSPRTTPRIDVWLLFIVVLATALRLQHVSDPIAEAHTWRQITNADIARNFAQHSLNIFYPQVSWGGPSEAFVGMEFPFLHWLGALAFLTSDDPELILRLIAIAFSVATVVGVYLLGGRLFGRPEGRAAAFLVAISPSAVFFGRTFISDTPMLCFSVLAVWGFAVYFDTGRQDALIWGSVAAALACLVKIPAVIIFAPIGALALHARGWSALRDRRFILAVAIALAATIAWYVHGDSLRNRSGLGQAIWRPSGTYGPEITVAAGPMKTVSHWATLNQLKDVAFYREIGTRIWSLHLTPPGTVLALAGFLFLWKRPRRLVVDAWLATVVLFILVSAEGNRYHEFHQLPLLPPAALYFGLAAASAFDWGWLRNRAARLAASVAAAAVLTAVGVHFFYRSGVIPMLFRPHALNYRIINAGKAIENATAPDQLVMTVEYAQYGANSPLLLYRAHRKGWSFDLHSVTPHVLQRLRVHQGARYFATTIWTELAQRHPDLARYLEAQRRIPLGLDEDVALFELN